MMVPSTTALKANRHYFIEEAPVSIDELTQDYINIGLGLQQSYGTSCAIEYLQGKGGPNKITERVLLRANQIR